MRHSNCVLFAWRQWRARGGYLCIRKSRYGWWWHVEWSPDLIVFHSFDPVAPKRRRWCPPLLFRGKVRIYQPSKRAA